MLRSRTRFLTLLAPFVLVALLAEPAFSADREYPATAAAVARPATLGVQSCKSNAYYSARQLSFRAKIARQSLAVPQKLAVRVSVYRRNLEERKFRKVSSEKWASASDPGVGIYQHDVIVSPDAIETRAEYRAKATFRWSNATTGAVEARKSVWSKRCKQRTKLPKLRVTNVASVPVPGSAQMTHTVTVSNTGASEAVNPEVRILLDPTSTVVVQSRAIDSIGPKQVATVSLTLPSCKDSAAAFLMPTKPFDRHGVIVGAPFAIANCK